MSDFKTKTVYNENEWTKLVKAEILKIVDEQIFSAWLESVADGLGYTMEVLEIPDWEYTTMLGTHWLPIIGEFDEFPIINREQGYRKGYKLQRAWGAVAISRQLQEWINIATSSDKLSPLVKAELSKLARDTQRLVNAAKITKNELATEVLSNWFDSAKSFYPDGQPLFSASHKIKSTWATQSNLVSGALTTTTLLEAVEKLRNMRDGMGRKMKINGVYTLIVPSELEDTARQVLNDWNNFAAITTSNTQAQNDVTINLFSWNGFKVELMVLETLNQPKLDGTTVGTATQWFVMDKTRARELEALKYLQLYTDKVDMYVDNKTKVLFFDIDLSMTCDFYNYEFICGSTGV